MSSTNAFSAASVPVSRYFSLSAFWFGSSFHWLLLLLILMPASVVRFVGDEQKGTYLGLMLGVGAVIALVMPPLVGALSDRLGRRMVFLRWGAVINVLGIVLMALAPGYWLFFLGFLVVQFGNNLATAPYSALIPELVRPQERGRASGIMGFLQAGGQLLGALCAFVFGLLQIPALASYASIAVVLLLSALVTLHFIPEPQPRERERAPSIPWWRLFALQAFLWVFVTRVLFSFGQYSVQPFLQFYVGDVLNRQTDAATVTSVMLLCIIVGSILSTLIGGRLSDRVGRKPVIYVAGVLMAACALLFLVAPNLPVALAFSFVFGLGYGAFVSVDWALGSDAMPSAKSYARDMGVWHIAFVAPQMSSAPQGLLLDWGNRQSEHLGYTLVFGIAAACFLLGVVLIRQIRDVR
ncbi:MFS transporter [Deinococcus peraridilitoris]|uniref:Arabinose efflux permease family protein n=1 Tax=Deinococcus peraridilitoris (strain DSM 19664 / LMG 22246 / CIP 109416 / KR-200) TaxID=937777 RepID=K9ZZP2_DEIPD|nr:MFS transporter [Deinococcus peraridilitoris]AFZ66230.1 arabinose efflux permease family protein [Deinococcus peraridilitoris DSM 19664]